MPALMNSELPEVMRTRHHWIVLLQPPQKPAALALLGLLVLSVLWPWPWGLILLVTVVVAMGIRVQTWQAEVIILTRKRVLRTQGVPETTVTEASLRVDRVSGVRLTQTVPGKLLGYGTIDLEAPGNHPEVRKLRRIAEPNRFYAQLRALVFGDDAPPDPDADADANSTQPIPVLPHDPPPSDDHHDPQDDPDQ
jgi:hypothetical protein